MDYNKHCRVPFGSYVQTHEENIRTNSLQARTLGAITLGPDNSNQVGYYFLNLNTGQRIHRRSWTLLPMPDFVIQRVEALGRRDNQPNLLTFTDKQGQELLEPEPEDVPDDDLDPAPDDLITGVTPVPSTKTILEALTNTNHEVQQTDFNEAFEQAPNNDTVPEPPQPQPDNHDEPVQTAVEEVHDDAPHEQPPPANVDNNNRPRFSQISTNEFTNTPPAEPIPEDPPETQAPRRSTRTPKPTTFLTPSFKGKTYDYSNLQFHCMTQLSMKRGLKMWGHKGESAVFSELQQLHLRNVFRPVSPRALTLLDKKKALESHLFLKEKRDLSIKGRLVAGGNKQRSFIDKSEATSPTPHTESVFITASIDAAECRDLAAIDIPNAFIQTDLQKNGKAITIIMVLRGKLAQLMIKTAPEIYKKHATTDRNGNTILYVRLLKALYGIMQASLFYYTKTIENLQDKGFVLNPYDPCVANKTIKGKQCTIIFHVDDMKISHPDPMIVTRIIDWLKDLYQRLPNGEIAKMKVQRGKKLEYLGMDFDFSTKHEVKITMADYIKKLIKDFITSTDMKLNDKPITTPASPDLFQIDTAAKKLCDNNKKIFHHTVAQLLYFHKRSRPDLAPAVPFLTTRVSDPDQDDWKKLCEVIQYLHDTILLPLILSADKSKPPTWWIDASYAVHPDCKSHTGGIYTLGKGSIFTVSCKQKLNTKSSTEAELVAVDDCVPHMFWANHFLEEQGYTHPTTVVHQDNRSAILLEQNGILSSTRRTKHINVRYYFIKDKIDCKELIVKWCPTDDMIADYTTKPLSGEKFAQFRKAILNLKN